MPRNGAGIYSLPEAAFVYDTVVSETAMNSNLSDIAAALSASVAADGQRAMTANLALGNNRITGVADGIAATDVATVGQIGNQVSPVERTAGTVTDIRGLFPR